MVDSLTTSVSTTQAGAHADLGVSFALGTSGDPETAKEVVLGLPPGFFMAPSWILQCGAEEFNSSECPNSSLVGLITIYADYEGDPSHLMGTEPVYLLEPTTQEPARLGFAFPVIGDPVEIPVRLRSDSDYGLDLPLQELPASAPLASAELSLWGIPASQVNDNSRPLPGECAGKTAASCVTPSRPPGSRPMPFLINPTRCGISLQTMLALSTYERPDAVVTSPASMASTTGCNNLPFGPSLSFALTGTETSSPSGIDIDLTLPEAEGVGVLEPAAMKWMGLVLPDDFNVNAETAAALGVCTNVAFGLGTDEPAACPSASKVGAVSLEVAGLEAPLEGEAFFGTPTGSAYRIMLDASGAGTRVKLEALLEPEFEGLFPILEIAELPEIPIRNVGLSISDAAGLLITSPTCGPHFASGAIGSWSEAVIAYDFFLTLNPAPDEGSCSSPPTGGALSPPALTPTLISGHAQPPVATITTHPPKRTTKSKMKFKFVSNPPASSFECKLDKARWRRCALPKTVRGLTPGKHVLRVRALDAAGNHGPADRATWHVVAGK